MAPAEVLDTSYARVCYRPRAIIRSIVESDPQSQVFKLVLIAACLGSLAVLVGARNPTAFNIGKAPVAAITPRFFRNFQIGAAIAGPLLAVPLLYINGAFLRWSGSLLGGTATALQVRAAIAWSSVPFIVATVIRLPLLFLHTTAPATQDFRAVVSGFERSLPLSILTFLLYAWHFVVFMKCVGEVHRFSVWKAVGAWLIEIFTTAGGAIVLGLLGMVIAVLFR